MLDFDQMDFFSILVRLSVLSHPGARHNGGVEEKNRSPRERHRSVFLINRAEKGSVEFLLLRCELQSTGTMKEGTKACPPHTALALSDNDVVPVQGLSYLGEPQRRG
jgi:hypothetical protein